jgi:hypothetical protein
MTGCDGTRSHSNRIRRVRKCAGACSHLRKSIASDEVEAVHRRFFCGSLPDWTKKLLSVAIGPAQNGTILRCLEPRRSRLILAHGCQLEQPGSRITLSVRRTECARIASTTSEWSRIVSHAEPPSGVLPSGNSELNEASGRARWFAKRRGHHFDLSSAAFAAPTALRLPRYVACLFQQRACQ